MISNDGLIYIAQHPNSIRNQMALPASGIVSALLQVSTKTHVVNFPKKRTSVRKWSFIDVETNQPELHVQLEQATTILTPPQVEEGGG